MATTTDVRAEKHLTREVDFTVTRTENDDDGLTLEGYAAVFNESTMIDSWEGKFSEQIAPGAFKRTIDRKGTRGIRLQFDHGHHPLIGSIPIGSIEELREDTRGLFVRARMHDNWMTQPVRDSIREGSVNGMSFRFRVVREDVDSSSEPEVRTVKEVELFELGPVVWPAYEQTSVGVRASEIARELADPEQRVAVARALLVGTSDDEDRTSGEPAADDGDTPPEPAPVPVSPEPAAPSDSAARDSDTDNSENRSEPTMAETMTVEERTERQGEISARLSEIDTEYNGATLPDDIQAEWDRLNTEYDEHADAVRADSARKERLRALADKPGHTERGVEERRAPEFHRQTSDVYDMTAIRKQARSVDDLPGLYRDNAMRAIERSSYPGVDKERAQGQVERLLETVDDDDGTLARRILATGSPLYQRAFGKAVSALSTNGLTGEEQRALAVGTGASGGFAVPFQLDPTVILTSDGSINPLRSVSRVESITTKTWQGVTSEGIVVTRAAEAAEATDADPDLVQPEVTPTRVHGFVPFSIEIDQDWNALRSEMSRMLADAKEQEEASSFVTGDGTGVNPGGVVGTLATSSNVDVSGSGVASANLYALEEALPPRFRSRARFMANKSVYNEVRQLSSASDGGDLWVRLAAGQPSELIGYPAHELSSMDPSGTIGNRYLLFGDFGQFLIVDRVGMSVELIPHLFGTTANFPTGQRGIYAIWRNSSVILTANAFRVLNGIT